MSVYKRGNTYYYNFTYRGVHVQESTQQGSREVARDKQAECRARMIEEQKEREVGARKLNCQPQEFRNCSDCGNMRLDRIEEEQVAAFIAKRRVMKKRGGATIKATMNRELEVLRHALRLA